VANEERAGSYKEYPNHFKLSESNVRKIHSVLEEYAAKTEPPSKVVIYIDRDDNSYFETGDLEKVLLDENTTGKPIETLSMTITANLASADLGEPESKRRKAFIGFTGKNNPKIRILTTYKSRDWCYLLIDELDTQVQRTLNKTPFPWLQSRFLDLFTAAIVVFAFALAATWFSIAAAPDISKLLALSTDEKLNYLVKQAVNRNLAQNLTVIPAFAIGIVFLFFFIEFRPASKLVEAFNSSVFYWGDMVAAYDARKQTQSRIMWGVLVAFLVSIAAAYVSTKFI
jgi:hypothetical protein